MMPEESHGRRSLVGFSLLGHKELDTTERLYFTGDARHSDEDKNAHPAFLHLVPCSKPV